MKGVTMKAINSEIADKIREDLLAGEKTKKSIAETYGVHYSTVLRIAHKMKEEDKTIEETTITNDAVEVVEGNDVVEEKEYDDNTETIIVDASIRREELEVGLIAGRHEMPVNNYIFTREFNDEEIFDYALMNMLANKWMAENCYDSRGNVVKDLLVYTTGLTSAMLTVTKICHERQINLTVLHYNFRNTKKYVPQKIFSLFGKEPLCSVFHRANETIHVYGMNYADIEKASRNRRIMYAISNIDKTDQNHVGITMYVFASEDVANRKFMQILQDNSKSKRKKLLAFEEGIINSRGVYCKKATIARCYNFDAY